MMFSSIFFSSLCFTWGQVFENYDDQITIEEKNGWYSSPSLAKVTVDLDEFPLADIGITVPGGASVFVDGAMWFLAARDTNFTIPSKLLKERFSSNQQFREIAVYKEGIQKENVSIHKGLFEEISQTTPDLTNNEAENLRETHVMEEFFFIAVFIVFFLLSLFKLIYPLVLTFIIHPKLVFSSEDFSESNSLTKFFSEEILFFLLIFNMLLMLLIMSSAYFLDLGGMGHWLLSDLNHLFFIWIAGTGILLLISLLKFIWLKLAAAIFGITKFEFIHFFYMLRIASILLIAIYGILIISLSNNSMVVKGVVNYLLMGFFLIYILGAFILFFIMTKKVSFKKYHLFSYLCTAELVPFLVLSKLIIG